jgi:UDP-3-O-[3-hydroxymyristoyl] glucosamine N-acyltransferase
VIDPRFYAVPQPLPASDIAAMLGVAITRGDPSRLISSLAPAGNAGVDDIVFAEDAVAARLARSAGVVLVAPEAAEAVPEGPVVITLPHPRAAFGRVAERLAQVRVFEADQPRVHPSARVSATAVLEPGVVIGAGAALGPGVLVGANAVIGPGVQVGANTRIGANASIRCALIGDGVILYPATVIGEAGFGLAGGKGGARLTPHFGRVIIQNGVSVGAGSCIDRGLLEDTVIGEGSHIDNLCHIGHNCRIGAHVVMAAFAGISGSCEVGDGVQFGGRVGLKDHVKVGAGARIAAGAAVLTDVPAGETWAGYPAKPSRTWMRELAWLARAAQKRPDVKE